MYTHKLMYNHIYDGLGAIDQGSSKQAVSQQFLHLLYSKTNVGIQNE